MLYLKYTLTGQGGQGDWDWHVYTVCVCSGARLCPTLCDPMDYSPPGFSVHGIL